MKSLFCMAWATVVLMLAAVSCSDDSGEEPQPEQPEALASVTINNVEADGRSITANVTTQNAVAGAYVCIAEPVETAVTDEQVLGNGTRFKLNETVNIVHDGLDYETAYKIVVAVKDAAGHTASASATVTTGKNPVTNLATDLGGAANTYIVPAAGRYMFSPLRVNGSRIEGIESVDWIWASKSSEADTEQRLISDMAYTEGMILFTAAGERGNAAVGAFDKSGKCIWVWLLWFTDQPADMEYASGAWFLDRAIGATSANPADGVKMWGDVIYQWGRSVPLFSGYEDEMGEAEVFNEARKWTVMNPARGFEWGVEKHLTTIEGSFAAPTTFFVDTTTEPINWTEGDQTLWGKVKTNYDPCPFGYRLPSIEEWGTLVDDLVIDDDLNMATYTYKGQTAYYPKMNNGRLFDTGENCIGYPGFTVWNCEYTIFDPMGFTTILDQLPYTLEELVAMGLVSYYPSRTYSSYSPGSIKGGSNVVANNSFAFAVRCVREV